MPQTIERIKIVASEARLAFEQRTVPKPLLRSLYLEYAPGFRNIDEFLDFAEEMFPVGNCGLAAVYLKHLFGEGEIIEGEYIIEPHQFLKLGELAVDITADQFGGPPVYVGTIDPPWGLSCI